MKRLNESCGIDWEAYYRAEDMAERKSNRRWEKRLEKNKSLIDSLFPDCSQALKRDLNRWSQENFDNHAIQSPSAKRDFLLEELNLRDFIETSVNRYKAAGTAEDHEQELLDKGYIKSTYLATYKARMDNSELREKTFIKDCKKLVKKILAEFGVPQDVIEGHLKDADAGFPLTAPESTVREAPNAVFVAIRPRYHPGYSKFDSVIGYTFYVQTFEVPRPFGNHGYSLIYTYDEQEALRQLEDFYRAALESGSEALTWDEFERLCAETKAEAF